MAVVEMRRVTILGHQPLRDAVLQELQRLGMVQVDHALTAMKPEELEAVFGTPTGGRHSAPGMSVGSEISCDSETEATGVRFAVDLLDRFFRPKKGVIETFAGLRFSVSEQFYRERGVAKEQVAGLVARAEALDERLTDLQTSRNELSSRLGVLRPWADLDAPREELADTRLYRVATGTFDVRDSALVAGDFEHIVPPVIFAPVSQNRDNLYAVLCYPRAREDDTLSAARRHGWKALVLPAFTGPVAAEVDRVERTLAELAVAEHAVIDEVHKLLAERLTLYARYEHLRNLEAQDETKALLGYGERIFVLRGWARRRDVPRLRQALEHLSPALVLEAEEPTPGEEYPVDLENPPLARPFEVVTRVAGLPQAGALDPSPFLAPFFFIFFGLMLGDAGYGIVLGLAGLWLVKRAKAVGLGRQLMYLLSLCGISTFAAGVLTGSWFGNLFGIPPLWFDPLKNPVKMLILSIALGVIQIFTALGVKAYDNIRRGNRLDALYDQGFWIVFLSGLVMMLVGAGGPALAAFGRPGKLVALAGAAGLILTQGRSHKNPLARLGAGLLSLYGVSSYLSDVLSYSRLLALGLSGSVIGMVLNYGAKLIAGVPIIGWLLMVVILVAGHLFDLLISAVGAYVHASRLQYVEFFTKFFEAGGKPFKPLAEGHRYLFIEPDAAPSKQR